MARRSALSRLPACGPRIICDAVEGDKLTAGEHYGIIRFGSRVDVWLPKPCKPMVLVGQRSIAGETVLARFGRTARQLHPGQRDNDRWR